MKVRIILNDKREIETDIDNDDFEELKKGLTSGQIKFINLENKIIKTSFITSVEEVAEPLSKEFRLPEVGRSTAENNNDKPVKVPGGFQKPSVRKRMIELFNQLKANGCFADYDSYEAWEKAHYKE